MIGKLHFFAFFSILTAISNSAVAATYYSYVWSPTATRSVSSIRYTGVSGGESAVRIASFTPGSSVVTARKCDTTDGVYYTYRSEDFFFFVPKVLTIADFDSTLSIANGSQFNTAYNFGSSTSAVRGGSNIGRCSEIGSTYNITQATPALDVILNLNNNIPIGRYTGNISIKYAMGEYFSKTTTMYKFNADEVFTATTSTLSVPYDITINGTCQMTPSSVTMDFGRVVLASADNTSVTANAALTCTAATRVNVRLETTNPSTTTYPSGIGVNLGNGWDANVLLVDPSTTTSGSTLSALSLSANIAKPIQIRSTLKRTPSSSIGTLNGVANVIITFA